MAATICRGFPVLLALYLALVLAGCATTASNLLPEEPAMHVVSEFSDDDSVARTSDPWEGFNQSMYRFNYTFDKYVFLPVVSGYEFITPTVIQEGATHFFTNVGEVRTLYNSLLQLKAETALITLGRFVTNTTLGIGGLFDPATNFGLQQRQGDFGQTLGVWGVGTGPYLVLPILGPNTVRSASGFAIDAGIRYAILSAIGPFEHITGGNGIQAGLSALEAIDMRHQEKFRYHESGNPFEYYLVRFLSRETRELAIMK